MSDIKQKAIAQHRQSFSSLISQKTEALRSVIPSHINPDPLIARAKVAMQENEDLMECEPATVLGALHKCMQLGLAPNTSLGHCYLIPYKKKVSLVMGYKGLIQLAHNAKAIASWQPYTRYEREPFNVELGTVQKLTHTPILDNSDKGKPMHYYSVCQYANGARDFRFMDISDIESHRAFAGQPNSVPWTKHYDAMAMKTVMRMHAKYLPLSVEAQMLMAEDDKQSVGENNAGSFLYENVDYSVVTDSVNTQENTDG